MLSDGLNLSLVAQGTSSINDLSVNNQLVHYVVGIGEEAIVGGGDGHAGHCCDATISEEER